MTTGVEAAVEGTSFGRYRMLKLLGRGGMGEVWRAHDTEIDRIVAIKLLPKNLAADDTFVERFRREAEAAARLNSPHVVPIHTYGELDGRLYVDMRLIEGRDLHSVIKDGPLEPARAVRIIDEVARALHAAHRAELVHRDVKPSNILLDEDDFAYLIDFGLARSAGQAGLTSTGTMIGSFHYMAPERMRGRESDARADIYALACVLHECLTGRRPYPGDDLDSQAVGHLKTPPPRPSTINPRVPPQLDAVIATGMAKEPDHRYPTAVALAQAAQDAVAGAGPTPSPPPPVLPQHPPRPAPQRPTERVPGHVSTPRLPPPRPAHPPPKTVRPAPPTRPAHPLPQSPLPQSPLPHHLRPAPPTRPAHPLPHNLRATPPPRPLPNAVRPAPPTRPQYFPPGPSLRQEPSAPPPTDPAPPDPAPSARHASHRDRLIITVAAILIIVAVAVVVTVVLSGS